MELVSSEDIKLLLNLFVKSSFRAKDNDSSAEKVQKICEDLFAKDYKYSLINNTHGELATTYPSHLVILEQELKDCQREVLELSDRSNSHYNSFYEVSKLRDLVLKARVARCRTRFPVPVILFEGKHICRSATLSGGPEIYGRKGIEILFPTGQSDDVSDDDYVIPSPQSSQWQLFGEVRSQDIRLLKTLSVNYICDLMVENKKVKFGMNVTSSEKIDKENRYSDFTILSLPYPGCEFFREYRDNDYVAEGLVFDWNQGFVDAQLGLPPDSIVTQMGVEWKKYKTWDLVKLTQNYLKLLLRYLIEGTSGMLIHCISGWDRTPLFISLLRISLWADGKAHSSLTPLEITYLTIAYDWYLFGHNLSDRLSKGEEILFFCFYILKHLVSEEFSASKSKDRRISGNGSDTQLDGILLEEEFQKSAVRGSNTSLSSNCSSVSSRSQDNNPPALFTVQPDSGDESNMYNNGNIPGHLPFHYQKLCPSDNLDIGDDFPVIRSNTPPTMTNSSEGQLSLNGNDLHTNSSFLPPEPVPFSSTSPVAVPNSVRQRTESSSSAGCGSWQIISGTGSIRGSSSTRSSVSSPTLEMNHNTANLKSGLSQESPEIESSSLSQLLQLRREKLQTVRSIFYHAYCDVVGFRFRNGSESGGLSTLLDQFAEKVGIRTGRAGSE